MATMRVLVIGAGWAGLAAAVEATRLGHQVTVYEATRTLGGRARALEVKLPSGQTAKLDNGQHILIGAYSDALKLMGDVGVDTSAALLRLPLTLRYPDGGGLTLPDWRRPWFAGLDVAAGILQARGWSLMDKLSLLRAADAWRRAGFGCPAHYSVAQLCTGVSKRVMLDMIEPLVVSALNTPADRASAVVFLRVMRDALFAPSIAGSEVAGSNMLLPRQDLSQLFPQFAVQWLTQHGAVVQQGERVSDLRLLSKSEHTIEYPRRKSAYIFSKYDVIIMATPAPEAARLVRSLAGVEPDLPDASNTQQNDFSANEAAATNASATAWARSAEALQHEAIATVYAYSSAQAASSIFPSPVMALRSDAQQPAQFVFDRGALTGHHGLLAFVVSASMGDAATLEQEVIHQGRAQLGLADLQPVKTIVEKRATFACTPGLVRPTMHIANNILACGDYVDGPYPATLEGAVRSGLAAARALPH
jgi:hydroxysqualene dehydroxylase